MSRSFELELVCVSCFIGKISRLAHQSSICMPTREGVSLLLFTRPTWEIPRAEGAAASCLTIRRKATSGSR